MKLLEVFSYELAHRLRSPSTWVFAAILFGFAFVQIAANGDPAAPVAVNAPVRLASYALLASLLGMIVMAAIFGDAAVRDIHAEMAPLLYTSALGKAEYLGGRYLAAFTASAIVALAIPLGHATPPLLGRPDPAMFGPVQVAALVQPWMLLLVPNIAFVGAIMFAVGVLARQLIPVYLVGFGVLVSSLGAVNYGLVEAGHDPLAFGPLYNLTRHWTAVEQSTRLIGFPADIVANRVIWLAATAAVLALLHYKFRFAHPEGGVRRHRERIVAEQGAPRAASLTVPRVTKTYDLRTAARQTLAIARNSLAEFVAGRWFVVILLACVGLPMLWGWNVGDSVFETSTWPVTLLTAEVLLSGRAEPLFYVLVALFAGELVWKDRDVGVDEIADAMPVPNGAVVLGRFLALLGMLVLFLAAAIIGCMLIQLFQGYYRFEPGLYLKVVFGLNFADYVLFGALAMTIHVLVNQKYLGHIAVVLALGFIVAARPVLGIEHHLLVYNGRPGWAYSDMNGFGPYIAPIVWFKLYWAGWALLLGVLAVAFWTRGRESGLRHRVAGARARLNGPAVRIAGVASVLIVVLGGFIFYNTNVLNEYTARAEQGAPQAEYEKRYSRFAELPQPTIESAELRVEIYPDEQAVDLSGNYRLANRTAAPIDSVHVFVKPDLEMRAVSFDRVARPTLEDRDVGYRIYALDRALEPGASMQLSFDVGFRQRGFPNDELQTAVVANGAYFNRMWLPFVGYQPVIELVDAAARERFGLAPRPALADPDAVTHAQQYRNAGRNEDQVQIETIIGTAADQIAITPGVLRREWTENGRRYFHYATAAPTSFGAAVFSGKYAVREDRWNDVALTVFHHPGHDYNLDVFVQGMKASLEYYTDQFGPYPDEQLRIVEIPRYGSFGRAHPHTIAFTEQFFFSRLKPGEFDRTFFGTAHEVAHQWWGGQVRVARGFLSESLANYSAMMVTEKTFGPEAAWKVYDYQMNRYFTMRAQIARDVPLLEVEDQAYIMYGKGAVAMYLLRDYIGDAAVNMALRRYFEKHGDAAPPYATPLNLYSELTAVTPDSLRYLLTDLFETVTLWDVAAQRASAELTTTGEYAVTLDVIGKKVRADSIGNETEVPMDDFIEIGLFAAGEGGELGEPLYLERHRIRSGPQTIRITVPWEPARAGIDPHRKLIDRTDDGIVLVERAPQ